MCASVTEQKFVEINRAPPWTREEGSARIGGAGRLLRREEGSSLNVGMGQNRRHELVRGRMGL